MSTAQGVIYIATGERHINRARVSARSLKRLSPALPVTLFSDETLTESSFDTVGPIQNTHRGFADKVEQLQNTPYERTLFLDADTYVCEDLSPLFQVLDQFDLAVAHDTFRLHTIDHEAIKERLKLVPDAFPMFNTGVLVYKKSEAVWQFLQKWLQVHLELSESNQRKGESYCGDQTAFREVLYGTSLRVATLPTEYNCRFVHPCFVNSKVQILHGPGPDLPGVEREINRLQGNRVFTPRLGTLSESQATCLLSRWQVRKAARKVLPWLRRLRSIRKPVRKPSPVGWRAPAGLFRDRKDVQNVFTTIYSRSLWGHGSGSGSSPKNLEEYMRFLTEFLKEKQIRSVVDLGCGDWQFSRFIDWSGIRYLGIDLVDSVVRQNTEKFASATVTFRSEDILAHPEHVPGADLLIVKDVLQHLSNANVLRVLAFARKFKFAIIVNDYAKENVDCENGDTRPLDITKPPFDISNAALALEYAGRAVFVLEHRVQKELPAPSVCAPAGGEPLTEIAQPDVARSRGKDVV